MDKNFGKLLEAFGRTVDKECLMIGDFVSYENIYRPIIEMQDDVVVLDVDGCRTPVLWRDVYYNTVKDATTLAEGREGLLERLEKKSTDLYINFNERIHKPS